MSVQKVLFWGGGYWYLKSIFFLWFSGLQTGHKAKETKLTSYYLLKSKNPPVGLRFRQLGGLEEYLVAWIILWPLCLLIYLHSFFINQRNNHLPILMQQASNLLREHEVWAFLCFLVREKLLGKRFESTSKEHFVSSWTSFSFKKTRSTLCARMTAIIMINYMPWWIRLGSKSREGFVQK